MKNCFLLLFIILTSISQIFGQEAEPNYRKPTLKMGIIDMSDGRWITIKRTVKDKYKYSWSPNGVDKEGDVEIISYSTVEITALRLVENTGTKGEIQVIKVYPCTVSRFFEMNKDKELEILIYDSGKGGRTVKCKISSARYEEY